MNTYSGVKNVDTLLIKVAVSFNASWWLTMKSVVLPSALPVIFAGLRLAAGTSLLLLVAAEMIAGTRRYRRFDPALWRSDDHRPFNGRRYRSFTPGTHFQFRSAMAGT